MAFKEEIIDIINSFLPEGVDYKLLHKDERDEVYSAVIHDEEEDYLQYYKNFDYEWVVFFNDRVKGSVTITRLLDQLGEFKVFKKFPEMQQALPSFDGYNYTVSGGGNFKDYTGKELKKELKSIIEDYTAPE